MVGGYPSILLGSAALVLAGVVGAAGVGYGLRVFVGGVTAGVLGVLGADPGQWSPAYALVAGNLPTSEIVAASGSKSPIIKGEIAVSAAGPIVFRFNGSKGLTAWLDDRPLPAGDTPTADVSEGTHKLTLKVDTGARGGFPVRVEVAKPEGSSAEFSVVGGR